MYVVLTSGRPLAAIDSTQAATTPHRKRSTHLIFSQRLPRKYIYFLHWSRQPESWCMTDVANQQRWGGGDPQPTWFSSEFLGILWFQIIQGKSHPTHPFIRQIVVEFSLYSLVMMDFYGFWSPANCCLLSIPTNILSHVPQMFYEMCEPSASTTSLSVVYISCSFICCCWLS